MSEAIKAAEAMREAAVKKAEVMCLGLHIDSARRIISALRALPLPEAKPDRRDDALAKAREALLAYEAWEGNLILKGDWSRATVRLTQDQHDHMIEYQTLRNRTLAALAAAKGAG